VCSFAWYSLASFERSGGGFHRVLGGNLLDLRLGHSPCVGTASDHYAGGYPNGADSNGEHAGRFSLSSGSSVIGDLYLACLFRIRKVQHGWILSSQVRI